MGLRVSKILKEPTPKGVGSAQRDVARLSLYQRMDSRVSERLNIHLYYTIVVTNLAIINN